MVARLPLVIVAGQIEQLQSGDTLTGGAPIEVYDDFVPTLGQTVFTLSRASYDAVSVIFVLNHVVYYPTNGITVTGAGNQTVTYVGPVPIDTADRVRIYYFTTAPTQSFVDFTPTLGQTVFALPSMPLDASLVFAILNHAFYYAPDAFTVTGGTLQIFTWTSPIALDPSDRLRIYF